MAIKKLAYTAEEIDERLDQAHSHSNKSILDGITEAPIGVDSITFANLSGDAADNVSLATAFQSVEVSLASKQDTLVAGTGISIAADGKTISATGGDVPEWVNSVPSANQDILKGNPNRFTYLANSYTIPSSGEPYWVKSESYLSSLKSKGLVTTDGFDDYMSKADIQKTLVAGSGITIAADGKTISATGSGASEWGQITGTLSSQTDLQSALDAKQGTIEDVVPSVSQGQFITAVSQTNGRISTESKGMDNFAQGGTVSDSSYYLHGTTASGPIHKLKYTSLWGYIKGKINDFFGISDTALPVTGGSVQIKVEKVAALPASPDPNTIYFVSE